MPALSIIYNKAFGDIKASIRRLLNDLDTNMVAGQEHQLSEIVFSEFINISHEAGADPRVPTRPTSESSELSYAMNPGDYQVALEDSADIIAVDEVYTNLSTQPLRFLPRHEMDRMIVNDIQRSGSVQRADPVYWTMLWTQGTKSGNVAAVMQHGLQVYPAVARALTIYWPRTILDLATLDPSLTTGRPAFSYQLTYALQYKVASMLITSATDDALMTNKMDRGIAKIYWQEYKAAMQREQEERASFWQDNYVLGLQT